MDKAIFKFFEYEIRIGKRFKIKLVNILFFVAISILALMARITLFSIESRDYTVFLSKWFAEIKGIGAFKALGSSIGDYTPPYMYLMSFLSCLPVNPLFAIKTVSVVFDFGAALTAMLLVWHRYKTVSSAFLGYAVVLFAPTVLLNSAAWAQCDVIFTTLLLVMIYALLKNRPLLACVMFGLAFSFKLQAIFLLPFIIVMWLKERIKLKHMLAIPIAYAAMFIPAFIAGKPFSSLISIYSGQTGSYSDALSYNFPNIYTLISKMDWEQMSFVGWAGVLVAVAAMGAVVYWLYSRRFKLTDDIIVTTALFFALLIPFMLPYMHDRYGFIADVLVLIYVFYRPRQFPAAIGVTLVSLCPYLNYLFGAETLPFTFVMLIYIAAIAYIGADLYRQVNAAYLPAKPKEEEQKTMERKKPVTKLDMAKEALKSGDVSCAVVKEGKVLTAQGRGIKPIMDWIATEDEFFLGTAVADKVVGRAAALLFIYGGARTIYAELISEAAIEVLKDNNVKFEYAQKVENIINRDGTDICPMEKRVLGITSPSVAYEMLGELLKQMMSGNK